MNRNSGMGINNMDEDRRIVLGKRASWGKLFEISGKKLATRELALVMAEMIIKDQAGEAELKVQQPLKITETEDSWLVEGSREYDFDATPPMQAADGPYLVEVLKLNCQVVRAIRSVGLPLWED